MSIIFFMNKRSVKNIQKRIADSNSLLVEICYSAILFYYPSKAVVNGGTTCFLRETTPGKDARPSVNVTRNAADTLSWFSPKTRMSESESKILVTTNTNVL